MARNYGGHYGFSDSQLDGVARGGVGDAVLSERDDRRLRAATAAGLSGGELCKWCGGGGEIEGHECPECEGRGWKSK